MNYWLIKSEPSVYSWDSFVKERKTGWTGIRNYAARINLNAMKKGDLAFFYHSNEGTEIVGIAEVVKESYPEPQDTSGKWVAVDVAAVKKLRRPVTLKEIKAEPSLSEMALIRISRLSVSSVKPKEWEKILEMSESKI